MESTYGFVTGLTPTTVRLAGDSEDIPVSSKNADYTPVEGDKVAMFKLGARDGWVIGFKIGATV